MHGPPPRPGLLGCCRDKNYTPLIRTPECVCTRSVLGEGALVHLELCAHINCVRRGERRDTLGGGIYRRPRILLLTF